MPDAPRILSVPQRLSGLLDAGRRMLAPAASATPVEERRVNPRAQLRIGVQVRSDGQRPRARAILDINRGGFALEDHGEVRRGDRITVSFPGVARLTAPFALSGEVVRRAGDVVGVQVDREATPREALEDYGRLVRFYLRKRPLLEEKQARYFEARCGSCAWVGRVGERTSRCSRCGGAVEAF